MNEIIKRDFSYCIKLRNRIEVWVDVSTGKKLQEVLQNISGTKFIQIKDETVNTADIVGVFKDKTIYDAEEVIKKGLS